MFNNVYFKLLNYFNSKKNHNLLGVKCIMSKKQRTNNDKDNDSKSVK